MSLQEYPQFQPDQAAARIDADISARKRRREIKVARDHRELRQEAALDFGNNGHVRKTTIEEPTDDIDDTEFYSANGDLSEGVEVNPFAFMNTLAVGGFGGYEEPLFTPEERALHIEQYVDYATTRLDQDH